MITLRQSFIVALLGTASLTWPSLSIANPACDDPAICKSDLVGKVLEDSTVETVEIGNNTENTVAAQDGGALFSISVDGEHVAGTKPLPDAQRKTDLALEHFDVQVKFDGLGAKPILNVSTMPVRRAYATGEAINFLASNNYPAWISSAEIRIFDVGDTRREAPIDIVSVSPEGAATWKMPSQGSGKFVYVLRVTDGEGRFDETGALSLVRDDHFETQKMEGDSVAPGYGEDRTAIRNIPVYGGAVTVSGKNVPGGHGVTVMGDPIPVDNGGSFVVQRILPPGDHGIDIDVQGDGQDGLSFNRSINIPENEWFYVGLADFTAGKRFGDKNIEAVKPGDFKGTYTKGRLAFYLKGKIKGRYLLTAAADTSEKDIKSLFKGLDEKDPRQFLKRIDPDDYYPIYGDESESFEDAPTQGKFYVRLDKDDSHAMWGNFKTEIRGTEFLRNERALYGANGVYKSNGITSFGERKTEARVYAAQPGTLPHRVVLRGTGGSAYFMKHQDVTIGSETITVETRDRTTGRVLSRRALKYGEDYSFDYVQGVVLLRTPLSSSAAGSGPVQNEGVSDGDHFLIVSYEFTPSSGDVDGYAYGGRVQQWVGDNVRVGVTGQSEKTGAADQKLYGADIQFRKSERTYIELEAARSQGPGFGDSISTDGGLTTSEPTSAGLPGAKANAYRAKVRASLGEFTNDTVKGDFEAYYDRKQKGFSSLGYNAPEAEESWGAHLDFNVTDSTIFGLDYDERRVKNGKHDEQLAAIVTQDLNENLTASLGVTRTKRDLSSRGDGIRNDVGTKLAYSWSEHDTAYVFGQATVSRKGDIEKNHRVGVGGKKQLTEKLDASVEASYGSTGPGGSATLDYHPTAADHYYIGYKLNPDRAWGDTSISSLQGDDLGSIVAGARHKYSERLSAFGEENLDLFGRRRSLTQAYGVQYTPMPHWVFGGGFETGEIWDDTVNSAGVKNSDFDRTAISLSANYKPDADVNAHIKGEVRFDDSEDNSRDLTSYLIAGSVGYKTSEDWRLIISADAVFTDASESTRDGDYVETSMGYAYRPVDNDRFNMLFKYTFLYDNPGEGQVDVNGVEGGLSQRSHILSADAIYDVTPILSIGGKYGVRLGETRSDGAGWEDSDIHLGVLRADVHVVKNWDLLLEGRAMFNPQSETVDFGAVAAVYRQMSDNFRVGVGYNFGRFSDDLRDLVADDHGVFINATGSF
jgi:hypothetical protein